MTHHGDMRAQLQMPWKPPGTTGPTIVTMWTIASHITGDAYGATVYVGERDNVVSVFLVEKHGVTGGVSRITSLLRTALVTWRNGCFGITSHGYLLAMQQLKTEEPQLADRLLALPVQRALLKSHIGHEETVSDRALFIFPIKKRHLSEAHAMYLMRPLMAEWISSPMLGNRVWTLGIRSLQDLLCNLYVMKRPVSNTTQVNLFIWTRVHMERMLTAPIPLIPSNAPRVVLDILNEVDQILFSRTNLVAVYAPVFIAMTAMVTGPKAVVLETPTYRPQNQGTTGHE